MKNAQLHLITLIPPRSIHREIKTLKEEIKTRFGAKHALKLPAHLTLQPPFWVHKKKERLLQDYLEEFSEKQLAFSVTLDGFGCFAPRVIFVTIANPEPIVNLQQNLQDALPPSVFLRETDRQAQPINPHLTLATRDLQRNIFPQAWKTFKDRAYKAHFQGESLVLFQHDGKSWHAASKFYFKNN